MIYVSLDNGYFIFKSLTEHKQVLAAVTTSVITGITVITGSVITGMHEHSISATQLSPPMCMKT